MPRIQLLQSSHCLGKENGDVAMVCFSASGVGSLGRNAATTQCRLVAKVWLPRFGRHGVAAARPLRPKCRKSRFAGNQSAVSHVSSQAPVGFMVGTKRRAMGRREEGT